jgi:hypothetical protein
VVVLYRETPHRVEVRGSEHIYAAAAVAALADGGRKHTSRETRGPVLGLIGYLIMLARSMDGLSVIEPGWLIVDMQVQSECFRGKSRGIL